jgi:hypothetical protein
MTHNFTARDIEATIAAFVLLGLLTVLPGYAIGAITEVFCFNSRTLPARMAIAVCLSIAVAPIATYLCWLCLPPYPWLICAASAIALLLSIALKKNSTGARTGRLSRPRIVVLAILAGWVVLGTLCLVDVQTGHRLYVPVTSFDYMLRTAITSAIERTGIPPANPYFDPGQTYVLRYHYFWYMLCSLAARFGQPLISSRIAVIAGTLWSGIGLVAIVSLYTHLFRRPKSDNADNQMLVAVALLSVTGLDIVPLLITLLITGRFNASSEWWNEPVLSWVNSVFWQPHSIAALIACLTALLVIRETAGRSGWPARLSGAAIAGAALASAMGLSIYVAFVFAIILIVWIVTLLWRGRRPESALTCIAGVIALALSIPYLQELAGGAKAPISFTVRSFYLAEAFVGADNGWRTILANALSLPLNYFLEFGFFFVVGILQWKRLRAQKTLSDDDSCLIAMLATSLLLCTFLRSDSLASNDLGWRGIIFAQFVLLIWGAELCDNSFASLGKLRKPAFSFTGALLFLGLAATLYDVTMLRIYPILLDDFAIPRYHWLAPDRHLGERTYALREIYEKLKTELPNQALVQQNPDTNPGDLFFGLYADRQTAADTLSCGVVFGGSANICQSTISSIRGLFDEAAHFNSSQVDAVCRKLSISAVVVKDTDSVWNDRNSWVWKREPLTGNPYARAFLCGNNTIANK